MAWFAALLPLLSSIAAGAGTAGTAAAGTAGTAAAGAGTAAAGAGAAGAAGAGAAGAAGAGAGLGAAGTAAGGTAAALPALAGAAPAAGGAASGGSSGLGALQALWQHIQALKAGGGAVQSIGTPAGSLSPGNAMALGAGQNPMLPAPPPTPGASVQPLNTGNPTAANQSAQAAGYAGQPTPGQDPKASKLAQYAIAMKALNDSGLTSGGPPRPEASSFRGSAGGGPGKGLGPSPVGPSMPPPGPVTSSGTFLLSPAGKAAMARLQQSMTPALAA
jgi:hypothetical protein